MNAKRELRKLWKNRATAFWKDAIPYLRILLTGYMFVPIAALILLAFLYHHILTTWGATSYGRWFFSLLFATLLAGGRVRSFILEPDAIYLTPLEKEMETRYFPLSWMYSCFVQAILLFLTMLILSPLYFAMVAADRADFYWTCVILAVLAALNLRARFQEDRLRENHIRNVHRLIRWAINFLFLANWFGAHSTPTFVWIVLYGAAFIYYERLSKKKSLRWSYLVEIERVCSRRFYRLIGLFMDAPQVESGRVKRRARLISGIEKLPTFRSTPSVYLCVRSFVRYQDIFNLYIRVLFVAAIGLSVVDSLPLSIFLFLLFLAANAVQLTGNRRRLRSYDWEAIYPVSNSEKDAAFRRVVAFFLFVHAIIASFPLGWRQGWSAGVAGCAIGAIAIYVYLRFLSRKRWKKIAE